jgi:hypothetical protein
MHEWLLESLKLDEQEVLMVQADGPKRQVYITFKKEGRMEDSLLTTWGHVDYKHTNGEISHARISAAGLRLRRVQIVNQKPEVSN